MMGLANSAEPATTAPASPTLPGGAAAGELLAAGRRAAARFGRLRFGSYLAPSLLPVYEAVALEVGRRLEVEIQLVAETSYESCLQDANEVCFVCSLAYITFERRGLELAVPIAAPVLAGTRYRGLPIYFSDVIVHRDSPFRSFIDLRGRSWAYNEPLSHSGYGVTRYQLVRLGETNRFFGRVVEAGFHHEAIRLVASGEVDGAAIDSQVLEVELLLRPDLARRLRVVDSLGPSTIQPVAVSRRVPPELREAVRHVLLTLDRRPQVRQRLAHGRIERFVSVDRHSYDDIRRMLDTCAAAGFLELR